MPKILACVQYWQADQSAAYGLAELIADVSRAEYGGKCPLADFMFSARFDATLDLQRIAKIGRAFDQVHTYHCQHRANGWPAGCNTLAISTVRWFHDQVRRGRWDYDAIWLMEADSVPVSRDFITRVHKEWEQAKVHCLGFMVADDGGDNHINGNCLFSREFLNLAPQFGKGCSDQAGWDVVYREPMMRLGAASLEIFSDYLLGSTANPLFSPEQVFGPKTVREAHSRFKAYPHTPAWLHGLKDWEKGQRWARQHLLTDEPIVSEEAQPFELSKWGKGDPMVPVVFG